MLNMLEIKDEREDAIANVGLEDDTFKGEQALKSNFRYAEDKKFQNNPENSGGATPKQATRAQGCDIMRGFTLPANQDLAVPAGRVRASNQTKERAPGKRNRLEQHQSAQPFHEVNIRVNQNSGLNTREHSSFFSKSDKPRLKFNANYGEQ